MRKGTLSFAERIAPWCNDAFIYLWLYCLIAMAGKTLYEVEL
jgi:hypothetical protein